jgi:hypothetical protein
MKTLIISCIAILLYTFQIPASAGNMEGTKKIKSGVSLESKIESDGVSIFLKNDQSGIYHHFILEKSLDGKNYAEVARTEEIKPSETAQIIQFKDFPFDKNALSCVFYRVRAVDELGWFDFTNTVTVMRKQDLATNPSHSSRDLQGQF